MSSRVSRLPLLAFWLVPALVGTLGLRLVPSRLNPDLTLLEIIASQLLIWLPWGLWSLLISALGQRVPFERGNLLRATLAHIALAPVVLTAQIFVISSVTAAFGMSETRGFESTVFIGLRLYGDLLMVIYWAVVGTLAGIRWRERLLAEELAGMRLREDLSRATLDALRAQLNPHFLFNALNAVVTLIGRDPALARDTLVKLSDLLRATLATGDAQQTTLAQELELTARYLEIEQLRFADRLVVQWDVDEGLGKASVPTFTLQPLVENAIKHGLSRRRAPGVLRIGATASAGRLELVVSNDAPDSPTSTAGSGGAGIALQNLRARLQRLFGDSASLALEPREDGGMRAVVRLPYLLDQLR